MEILVKYGVLACFCSLVFTSFGLPIPEEISLFAIGALVKGGTTHWALGLLVGFLGVTIGDVIAWYMGRKVGLEPKGFVSRLIGEDQIKDIEQFYRKWGDWAIVIARQIPGSRFPTFFFAGASAIPLGRFYLIDGLAALITTNLYFWLGYAFANDMRKIMQNIDSFRNISGTVMTAVFSLIAILLIYRRFFRKV